MTTCGNLFFPSNVRVPGMDLRPSSLAVGVFTYLAVLKGLPWVDPI